MQSKKIIRFHIVSIFPELVEFYKTHSIIGRAVREKKIEVTVYNPRDYTKDKHRRTDLRPFGGGPGMVMMAEPILYAIKKIQSKISARKKRGATVNIKYVLLAPAGIQFTNKVAKEIFKKYTDIVIICGHYEGIDVRVQKILKAKEYSIGPYVLTGGELPSLAMIDCISRQVEGVLGNSESLEDEREASSALYTRPAELIWEGKKYKVPDVLRSGNHKEILEWKRKNKDKRGKTSW